MKGIDIIIPVHKYDETVKALLTRCLASVNEMSKLSATFGIDTNILVVGPGLPEGEIKGLVELDVTIVDNTTKENDFCSQVNLAVKECVNDYFMIVEYDDMVTPNWVKMAVPYIEARPKTSVFLPLVEVYDIKNGDKPTSYVNEIGWSSSFAENELGSLDVEALKVYCNFNITGGIFKKTEFVKAGGLKPSIKLSFGYELLLRMASLYGEVYVIPKVGYFHFTNREDSLTSEYHRTLSQEEGAWWIKLATQEYHFKKDRNKTYSPGNEE